MQALYPGRKTLEQLARWSPKGITVWRLRRLLAASYWCVHVRTEWLASDVIHTLPPPPDGILFEIGDGSHVPKRGAKNPTAQKGRESKYHPWFFGIRFSLLIVAWDVYRIPVAFRIILPKTHPDYRTEYALFREMLRQFKPPSWAVLAILQPHEVADVIRCRLHLHIEERSIRAYREQPARVEQVRDTTVEVEVHEAALEAAARRLHWRLHGTHQGAEPLSPEQAVLAYRNEYQVERSLGRLKGRPLSLTPMSVQRDDHATGLIRVSRKHG
jgi:hypothetical protein